MTNKSKWYSILLLGIVLLLASSVLGCQAPPLIVEFSATPSEISSGESAILFWSVTEATSISIDQDIGNVSAVGTQTVSPLTTTVYTLTASNAGGNVTWSVVITITPTSAPAPPEHVIPLAVPGFDFVEKSDRVEPIFEGEDYRAYSFFEPASSSKFQGKVSNLVVDVYKFKDETSAREFFSMFAGKEGVEEIQIDNVTAMLLYEEDMGLVTVFFQQGKLVIMSSAEGPFDITTLEFTVPDEQVLKNATIEGARAAARNL